MDGDDARFEHPRESSGRPGFRAPHVDLGGRSTLDLFGRGFVLLSPSQAWCDASPVEAHLIDAPAYGLAPEGASLIRPDGYVAWRTQKLEPEAASDALARVLGR